jgi:hypothetical protein
MTYEKEYCSKDMKTVPIAKSNSKSHSVLIGLEILVKKIQQLLQLDLQIFFSDFSLAKDGERG